VSNARELDRLLIEADRLMYEEKAARKALSNP
jgi:hypothetical protein